ncbi:PepSY-associated TM helix domain-containing protein [Fulvivirgaceae bacterium BMA10]|uniref:PepSY-associated TM helix domain-containing protein n=1 Tax=Splendidivirga corallicola TaxID=3051826 RepID=A0ABT8KIT1_9BACT|nr:PepSY-associated TM helix domain-containing protein [Fulvivirgaceae bacterium BMA10]
MNIKRTKRQKQAKTLRTFRKIHRVTGALLFIFFFIVASSGLLLGWKSHSNGAILPETQRGSSTNLQHWLSMDALQAIAFQTVKDSISTNLSTELDRIDARPSKGIVKFVFEEQHWEVQLDAASGKVLSVARRNSDLLEDIHDGSILDNWFDTSNKQIKLFYTNVIGLALLTFTITGFWLWYGPKRMRMS